MSAPARHWVLRSKSERIALRLPVRALVALALLSLVLLVTCCVSLATGTYGVALNEVIDTLRGFSISRAIDNVVWEFRFPRTLAAALVGAMMALSGAALQNTTRNGLADPSLVGVSQGAALAVVSLTVVFPDVSGALRPWAAFAGAILVALAIQGLSHTRQGGSAIRFILMGIGLSTFISSITSALMTYGDIDRAMAALSWLAGSINAASWSDVWTLGTWCTVLLPALLAISRSSSATRMGEATAISLGVRTKLIRNLQLAIAVALAAIATSVVGPLGFVGLIAPHAARRIAPAGIGLNLLITAMVGAALVSLADLVGRAAFAPIQIPAGLLTALIGVPLFIVLMVRSRSTASH
ncbi:ferrichrome ABC transporter permease [Devosia riboflavina]|uniref:Ferrichrome ABC transporter permease n=1 Tax=Devosia riboflavina TaxID=46914 RepID=A0A087M0U3_9HYPH|nr:iron ABC transporter permease [Devosia riboflavina]KFL30496.1 ferrichrome ABC transporter permease [Devosia riboflavina]